MMRELVRGAAVIGLSVALAHVLSTALLGLPSMWRHRLPLAGERPVRAVVAPNREALVDVLRLARRAGSTTPIIRIVMPCGQVVEYQTPDDIPDTSVACPCGNPFHWILWFEDDVPDPQPRAVA